MDNIGTMTDEERARIIALCEDPDEDFSDVQSRPATPEEIAWVQSIADDMFLNLPLTEKTDDILHLPPHVAARLVSLMPSSEATQMLELLPDEHAEQIASLGSH